MTHVAVDEAKPYNTLLLCLQRGEVSTGIKKKYPTCGVALQIIWQENKRNESNIFGITM